jgi:hypothetical protein
MLEAHGSRRAFIDRTMEDGLQMMLRHIDYEWIARLFAQQMRTDRWPCRARGSFDIADLIHPERFGENVIDDSIAAEGFQRACQDGAGLGIT